MQKAYLITVGDELLIGQVIDTNSAWLGQKLNEHGLEVVGKLAVGDKKEQIVQAIATGFNLADLVLMTGGLGPTKDDITKLGICQFFGVEMVFSESTYNNIVTFFKKLNRPLSESHKKQCYMPSNASLLNNKMGTAPGMLFHYNNKLLISMPGVPYEMKSIMEDEVFHLLANSEQSIVHKTLMTSGKGETEIEDKIAHIVDMFPSHIKIAYLPSLGVVRLRLTGKSNHKKTLADEVEHFALKIKNELGGIVYADEDINLESYLLKLFNQKKLTLSTAESCTGGFLAHRITSIPSSSSYYKGSIISYSNEIKISHLHVASAILEKFGAVSKETVEAMVKGALQHLDTDVAVAISGIAGPDGGSEEKPVGTIWIAVANYSAVESIKIKASKDRLKNIEYASTIAMNFIRIFVEKNY
jgi:nicotinamide-nucleotide amidase